MPYVFNIATGKLEDVQTFDPASHEVAVVSPEGELGSVPQADYQSLLKEGYKSPSSEQLQKQLHYDKFSTPTEQAKTFAESGAKAATLGLSTGVERVLGVDPKDIESREQVNPGTALAGELAGYGASALTGVGSVGMASRTGALAMQAAKSKLGAQAAKQAVEMAVLQGGDEVSKMFLGNADQTLENTIGHIGLAAALGGGMGAATDKIIEPLWKATKGSKLSQVLTAVKDKAQGISGEAELNKVMAESGIELAPEIRAAITPEGAGVAQGLRERATKSGDAYRESLERAQKSASDQAVQALGKSEQDVARIASLSEYEEGVAAKQALEQELKVKYDPITAQYEKIEQRIAGKELPLNILADTADQLNKVILDSGASLIPGSQAASTLNKINKGLRNVKTFDQLQTFSSAAREELSSKGLYDLSKKVRGVLNNAEESSATALLGDTAPELLGDLAAARGNYRQFRNTIDELNDRLKVGKYYGPKDFIRGVKEMAPEDVLRRLRGVSDVQLQQLLGTQFPSAAQVVKDYHVNSILRKASQGARAIEGGVDTRNLFKQLDAMSPELRSSVLSKEQQEKLGAIRKVVESLPERLNPSGTARAMDSRIGGAHQVAGMILTGDPIMGSILGYVGKQLSRDIPDAIKLGFLKVLGTEGPVSSTGFKSIVHLADQAYKAARATDKAVKSVMKGGSTALVDTIAPHKIAHLDKILLAAQNDPSKATEHLTGNLESMGEYLPEHAMAAGTLTARAVGYLQTLRPKQDRQSPLDPPRKPNDVEQARYERALGIAEQPRLVLEYIRQGSLDAQDVATIKTIYPTLYTQYQQSLLEQATKAIEKEENIPYKTAIGMSIFFGMPLESSMLPQVMSLNHPPTLPPTQASPSAPKPSQASLKGLQKGAEAAATPGQAREQAKLSR